MTKNIDNLLNELTLDEKSKLCSGLGLWNTKPIERLEIQSIMLTDGPIGIRKQVNGQDNLGIQVGSFSLLL